MKEIQLTQGKTALVDDRDFELVMRLAPWHVHKTAHTFYAVHGYKDGQGTRKLYMHHAIFGRKYGDRNVDHIDGNGLNNQRSNLRWSSRSQNSANRVKPHRGANRFKGVSLHKDTGKFYARISGKYLGTFTTEEDAARAYDAAAIAKYGEFARLNFPRKVKP